MKDEIIRQIDFGESSLSIRETIVDFRRNGGNQLDAYNILQDLREIYKSEITKENLILELMDYVTGWCQLKYRIWYNGLDEGFPKIDELNLDEITIDLVWAMIELAKRRSNNLVITPLNLFRLSGFPVSGQPQILKQKTRLNKLKVVLKELESKGKLVRKESMQDFLGIKEIGYNLSDE